jgi:hypothetical protein
MEAFTTPRRLFGGVYQFLNRQGEPVSTAYHLYVNAIVHASLYFPLQIALKQSHEAAHLTRRPLPVVGGEGVDRQICYTKLRRRFDGAL